MKLRLFIALLILAVTFCELSYGYWKCDKCGKYHWEDYVSGYIADDGKSYCYGCAADVLEEEIKKESRGSGRSGGNAGTAVIFLGIVITVIFLTIRHRKKMERKWYCGDNSSPQLNQQQAFFRPNNASQTSHCINESTEATTSFSFVCPHCKQELEADSSLIGQELNCPACGNLLTVVREQQKAQLEGQSDWYITNQPGKPAQKSKKGFLIGILVGGLVLCILAIIGMSIQYVIKPAFDESQEKAQSMSCYSNLKEIGLALTKIRDDNNDKYPYAKDLPDIVQNKGYLNEDIKCPSGDSYAFCLNGEREGDFENPSEDIIAYCPHGHGNGTYTYALCVDGHVQAVKFYEIIISVQNRMTSFQNRMTSFQKRMTPSAIQNQPKKPQNKGKQRQ